MRVGCGFLQGRKVFKRDLTEELRVSTGCGQMVWGKAWDPEDFPPQSSLLGCLEAFGEAWGVTV